MKTSEMLGYLQETEWDDGESLESVKARLTDEQLEAPARLVFRISQRMSLPSLLRARIQCHEVVIAEFIQAIPADVTGEDIDQLVLGWIDAGYIEEIG